MGAFFLFLLLTLAVFWLKKEYSQKVYPGVYLFSSQVSGKTKEQVHELLVEREERMKEQKIIFTYSNNTQKKWEITPQRIDFSLDEDSIVEEVFSVGRSQGEIGNFREIYQLILFPQAIEPKYDFNAQKLTEIIAQISSEVDKPAQDALFEFKAGKVVNFQVSKEGSLVDRDETKSLILLDFKNLALREEPISLSLPVKKIKPMVDTSQTNRLGIKEMLGEGESFFKDSIPSRVHNIVLAASYFHGVVVPPGEIFSFSEKIGTISAETGYEKAYVIKENKTILEDGGGVCQVSTTLFRAVLKAGLPVVERQAHNYRVGYYEQGGYPPGLDATVYPPSPDFKFKNDTLSYVLIQVAADQAKKRLVFQIYGTSDGRRVEMTKPVIHSTTPPPPDIYVDEPTLAQGVVKKIDSAHAGAKVSFERVVYWSDNSIKEDRTFWSNYVPWPAVYQRGIKTN